MNELINTIIIIVII